MRKSFLYLIALLALLSCGEKTYKIEGSVTQNDLNGLTVYIAERIDRVWTNIDSTSIVDNKFTFNGNNDSARIAFIVFETPNGERIRQPFAFENANISIAFDSLNTPRIAGSKNNDFLQSYFDARNSIYAESMAFYAENSTKAMDEAQQAEFDAKIQEFSATETNLNRQFAIDHVNTLVGTYVFTNNFFTMTIDTKSEIVALMNKKTLSIPRIKEIVENIEIERNTSVGSIYTDIKLNKPDGTPLALSEMVGKSDFVLVDFWASWCGPCIRSLPELKELYGSTDRKKLDILAVSLDNDKEAWLACIEKHELRWPHISDIQGWKSAGAKLYAVSSIPATVLIDKQGVIVGRNLSKKEIEKILSGN
jgi:thiol-disulfide isomerase/thioredoxin